MAPIHVYRDWDPSGQPWDHESNKCVEIGRPANRRRAEGSLYVLETAFSVQRALCTFTGKGHHVQKTAPVTQALQKWVPIRLNLTGAKRYPKC